MKNKPHSDSWGVIDIGSNTVLLSAGRLQASGDLEILLECHGVARLAEKLQDGGPLLEAAKERVLQHLSDFKAQANAAGITRLQAAGTAAFRRASDGIAFAREIEARLQIPTRILTGNEEAHYSFLSAQRDLNAETVGMIDIGGGSTEFVLGSEDQWTSLPLGTVRLHETFVHHDPITDREWQEILSEIQKLLEAGIPNKPAKTFPWVAVAATPTTLAAVFLKLPHYDPKQVHGYSLCREALGKLVEELRRLPLADRLVRPGMMAERAELLPVGGAILWQAMEFFGLEEIRASHQGLRYGMLWEILENQAATRE